jgi:hypothetical protein
MAVMLLFYVKNCPESCILSEDLFLYTISGSCFVSLPDRHVGIINGTKLKGIKLSWWIIV